MHKYTVRVYVASGWSMFTQADHFADYNFESREPLEEFAKDLARNGFKNGKDEWIMPGAILQVKEYK